MRKKALLLVIMMIFATATLYGGNWISCFDESTNPQDYFEQYGLNNDIPGVGTNMINPSGAEMYVNNSIVSTTQEGIDISIKRNRTALIQFLIKLQKNSSFKFIEDNKIMLENGEYIKMYGGNITNGIPMQVEFFLKGDRKADVEGIYNTRNTDRDTFALIDAESYSNFPEFYKKILQIEEIPDYQMIKEEYYNTRVGKSNSYNLLSYVKNIKPEDYGFSYNLFGGTTAKKKINIELNSSKGSSAFMYPIVINIPLEITTSSTGIFSAQHNKFMKADLSRMVSKVITTGSVIKYKKLKTTQPQLIDGESIITWDRVYLPPNAKFINYTTLFFDGTKSNEVLYNASGEIIGFSGTNTKEYANIETASAVTDKSADYFSPGVGGYEIYACYEETPISRYSISKYYGQQINDINNDIKITYYNPYSINSPGFHSITINGLEIKRFISLVPGMQEYTISKDVLKTFGIGKNIEISHYNYVKDFYISIMRNGTSTSERMDVDTYTGNAEYVDMSTPQYGQSYFSITVSYNGKSAIESCLFLPENTLYVNFSSPEMESRYGGNGAFARTLGLYNILLLGKAKYPDEIIYGSGDSYAINNTGYKVNGIAADLLEKSAKDNGSATDFSKLVFKNLRNMAANQELYNILTTSQLTGVYEGYDGDKLYPNFLTVHKNRAYWDASLYQSELKKLLNNHMIFDVIFKEKKEEDAVSLTKEGEIVAGYGYYRHTGRTDGDESVYNAGILYIHENGRELRWAVNYNSNVKLSDRNDKIREIAKQPGMFGDKIQIIHDEYPSGDETFPSFREDGVYYKREALKRIGGYRHKLKPFLLRNNGKEINSEIFMKLQLNFTDSIGGNEAEDVNALQRSVDFIQKFAERADVNLFRLPNFFAIGSNAANYNVGAQIASIPYRTIDIKAMIANDSGSGYKNVLYPSVVAKYEGGTKDKTINIEVFRDYKGSFVKRFTSPSVVGAVAYKVTGYDFADESVPYITRFNIIYDITTEKGENITQLVEDDVAQLIKEDMLKVITNFAANQSGEKKVFPLVDFGNGSTDKYKKVGLSFNIEKAGDHYKNNGYVINIKEGYPQKIVSELENIISEKSKGTSAKDVNLIETLKSALPTWAIAVDSADQLEATAQIPVSEGVYQKIRDCKSNIPELTNIIGEILDKTVNIKTPTGQAVSVTISALRIAAVESAPQGENIVAVMDLKSAEDTNIVFPFTLNIVRAVSHVAVADSNEYTYATPRAVYDNGTEYYVLESRTNAGSTVSAIIINEEKISEIECTVTEVSELDIEDTDNDAYVRVVPFVKGREGYFGIIDNKLKYYRYTVKGKEAGYIIKPVGVLTSSAVNVNISYINTGAHYTNYIPKAPIFNKNTDKTYIKFNISQNSKWSTTAFGTIAGAYLMAAEGKFKPDAGDFISLPQLKLVNIKTIGYKKNDVYTVLAEIDNVGSMYEIYKSYGGKEIIFDYTLGIESKHGNTAEVSGSITAVFESGSTDPPKIKNDTQDFEAYQSVRFGDKNNLPVPPQSAQFPHILIESSTIFERANAGGTTGGNTFSYSLYSPVNNTNTTDKSMTGSMFGTTGSVIEYPDGAMNDDIISKNSIKIAFVAKDFENDRYINRDNIVVFLEKRDTSGGITERKFKKVGEGEFRDVISNIDSSGQPGLVSRYVEIPMSHLRDFSGEHNLIHIAVYPTVRMRGTFTDIANKMKDFKYGKESMAFASYELKANSGDVYAKSLIPVTFTFELKKGQKLEPAAMPEISERESIKGYTDMVEKTVEMNIKGYQVVDNPKGISLLGLVSFNFNGNCALDGGLENVITGLGLNSATPLRVFDLFEYINVSQGNGRFVLKGKDIPTGTEIAVNKLIMTRNGFNVLYNTPINESTSEQSIKIRRFAYGFAGKCEVEFDVNSRNGYDEIYVEIDAGKYTVSKQDSIWNNGSLWRYKSKFDTPVHNGSVIKIYDNRGSLSRVYRVKLDERNGGNSAVLSSAARLSINNPLKSDIFENSMYTDENLLKGMSANIAASTPQAIWGESDEINVVYKMKKLTVNITTPTRSAIELMKNTDANGDITFDAQINYGDLPLANVTTKDYGKTATISKCKSVAAGETFLLTGKERTYEKSADFITTDNIISYALTTENAISITVSGIYFLLDKAYGNITSTAVVEGDIAGDTIQISKASGTIEYTGSEKVDGTNVIKGVYPIDAEFLEMYAAYTGRKTNDLTKEDYEFYLKSLALTDERSVETLVSSMQAGWADFDSELTQVGNEMITARDTEVQGKLDTIRKHIEKVEKEQMMWKMGFAALSFAADKLAPGIGGLIVSSLEYAATGSANFGVNVGGFSLGLSASKKEGITGGNLSYGVKGSPYGYGLSYSEKGGFSGNIKAKNFEMSYSKEKGFVGSANLGKYGSISYNEKGELSGELKYGNWRLTASGDDLGLGYDVGELTFGAKLNMESGDYQSNLKYAEGGFSAEAGYWSSGKFSASAEYHDKNEKMKSYTDARLSWTKDTKNNDYSTLDGYVKMQRGQMNSSKKLDTYGMGVTGNYDFVTKKGKLDGYVSMNGFNVYQGGMNIDPELGIKRFSTDFSKLDYWKRLAAALPNKEFLLNRGFELGKWGVGQFELWASDLKLGNIKWLNGFKMGVDAFIEGLTKDNKDIAIKDISSEKKKNILEFFGVGNFNIDFGKININDFKNWFGFDPEKVNLPGLGISGTNFDLSGVKIPDFLKFARGKRTKEAIGKDMAAMKTKLETDTNIQAILKGDFKALGMEDIISVRGDEKRITEYVKARLSQYISKHMTEYFDQLPPEQAKELLGEDAYNKLSEINKDIKKTKDGSAAILSKENDLGDVTLFPGLPYSLNMDVMADGKKIFGKIALPTITTADGRKIEIPASIIIDEGGGSLVMKNLTPVDAGNPAAGYKYIEAGKVELKNMGKDIMKTVIEIGETALDAVIADTTKGLRDMELNIAGVTAKVSAADIYLAVKTGAEAAADGRINYQEIGMIAESAGVYRIDATSVLGTDGLEGLIKGNDIAMGLKNAANNIRKMGEDIGAKYDTFVKDVVESSPAGKYFSQKVKDGFERVKEKAVERYRDEADQISNIVSGYSPEELLESKNRAKLMAEVGAVSRYLEYDPEKGLKIKGKLESIILDLGIDDEGTAIMDDIKSKLGEQISDAAKDILNDKILSNFGLGGKLDNLIDTMVDNNGKIDTDTLKNIKSEVTAYGSTRMWEVINDITSKDQRAAMAYRYFNLISQCEAGKSGFSDREMLKWLSNPDNIRELVPEQYSSIVAQAELAKAQYDENIAKAKEAYAVFTEKKGEILKFRDEYLTKEKLRTVYETMKNNCESYGDAFAQQYRDLKQRKGEDLRTAIFENINSITANINTAGMDGISEEMLRYAAAVSIEEMVRAEGLIDSYGVVPSLSEKRGVTYREIEEYADTETETLINELKNIYAAKAEWVNSIPVANIKNSLLSNLGREISGIADAITNSGVFDAAASITTNMRANIENSLADIDNLQDRKVAMFNYLSAIERNAKGGFSSFSDISFTKYLSDDGMKNMFQDMNNIRDIQSKVAQLRNDAIAHLDMLVLERNKAMDMYNDIVENREKYLLTYAGAVLDQNKIGEIYTQIKKFVSYENGRIVATADAPQALREEIIKMAGMDENGAKEYILNNANTLINSMGLGGIINPELAKYPLVAVLTDMMKNQDINLKSLINSAIEGKNVKKELEERLTSLKGVAMDSVIDAFGMADNKYANMARDIIEGDMSGIRDVMSGSDITQIIAAGGRLLPADNEKFFTSILNAATAEGEKGKSLFNDMAFLENMLSPESLEKMGSRVLYDSDAMAMITDMRRQKELIENNITTAKGELSNIQNRFSYNGEVLDFNKVSQTYNVLNGYMSGNIPATGELADIVNTLKNKSIDEGEDYILRNINSITEKMNIGSIADPELLKYSLMMSLQDIKNNVTTNINNYKELTATADIGGIVSAVYDQQAKGISTLYTLQDNLNIAAIKEEYLNAGEKVKGITERVGEAMKYVTNYVEEVREMEALTTAVSTIRTAAGTQLKVIKSDVEGAVTAELAPIFKSINTNLLRNDMKLRFKAQLKQKK